MFIVGMMRSGTSLVEQIIASHPSVFGAGELDFWHRIASTEGALVEKTPPDSRKVRKLAQSYLSYLKNYAPSADRIIDKSTLNLFYIGLIHRTFPRAKIIYLRRNPLDTCLSCYFKNFVNGAAFTLDLEHLAHFYKEHLKLATHWGSVLPRDSFLEIPYEELVENQEVWSRRILEFLDLEWNSAVLEFHKTERVVRTASLWQVRKALYKTSIGKWRNYRKWLPATLIDLGDNR